MGQGKSRGAVSPVDCAAPAFNNLGDESADPAHWIFFDNPALRLREIRTDYDFTADSATEIGKGHFGTVHLGTRKVDDAKVRPAKLLNVDFYQSNGCSFVACCDMQVAIKTVPKLKKAYVDMVRNEVAILRLFQHSRIIRLYDVYENAASAYLVFEWCPGGDLIELINNRDFRFSERQASRILRQTLEAIKEMHNKNICHRDIKPDNIVLSQQIGDCDITVIDFGLAVKITPGKLLSEHAGTAYYIAPEVLDRSYGLPCDMWSVGVVAFMMLCGSPPFFGNSEQIYGRIRRGLRGFSGPEWRMRSNDAKDFIVRLLRQDPGTRLTADEALARPWIVHEGEVPALYSPLIINRMRRFAHFSWIKRVGIITVSSNLSRVQRMFGKKVWFTFATKYEDKLTPAELHHCLAMHETGGLDVEDKLTPAETAALLGGLDVDGDGLVSCAELSAAVMPRLHYLNAEALMSAFRSLDVDGDGLITQDDLQAFILSGFCGAQAPPCPSPAVNARAALTARAALMEADFMGPGTHLHFDSFVETMCGDESAVL